MSEIKKQWYVVRAIGGKENKVKEYIEAEIRHNNLEEYISQVLIPTEKVYTIRNGKKVSKEKVSYPGYVLVEAAFVGQIPIIIRNTPNVLGFLGDTKEDSRKMNATPLRPQEVARILGRVDEMNAMEEENEIPFFVGETVKVTAEGEDEAAAAAKVKNLITEMSHDLRTPLTTLLLYTEILRHRKYETTAQAEDYLAKIDTKARQLKQLSDNLFEYALVTRDTVAVLDPPTRFSQIFEEPLTEMVGELQERSFACALDLGEEDDTLTVKEQYVHRILDNITSNLLKYADPAQDISVRFVKENGKAGLAFENAVLPGQHRTDSTKVGLTSIETMMEKMHAVCRIEQSGERFCITLLFPIALSVTPQA